MSQDRDPNQVPEGTQPPEPGPARPRIDDDRVEFDSDRSFPASDPPGWADSGGVSRDAGREAPPAGPQAAWSVEVPDRDRDEDLARR